MGFKPTDLRLQLHDLGFRLQGLGFRVSASGFLEFRLWLPKIPFDVEWRSEKCHSDCADSGYKVFRRKAQRPSVKLQEDGLLVLRQDLAWSPSGGCMGEMFQVPTSHPAAVVTSAVAGTIGF